MAPEITADVASKYYFKIYVNLSNLIVTLINSAHSETTDQSFCNVQLADSHFDVDSPSSPVQDTTADVVGRYPFRNIIIVYFRNVFF